MSPPFSMPCGWSGWDLNEHKLMHERADESPNCDGESAVTDGD